MKNFKYVIQNLKAQSKKAQELVCYFLGYY